MSDRSLDVVRPPLPPERLRFMNDRDDETFLRIAAELAELVYSRGLPRDGRMLDVGSGYGRLAIGLMETGYAGRYLGFDILKRHVRWCRRALTTDPRYRFRHLDVVNARYNPNGTIAPEAVRFPCPDASQDCCALFSVFTHFYEADIRRYLAEIERVLVPGGRAVTTWFLFDQARLPAVTAPESAFPLVHVLDAVTRYETPEDPLKAIGYDEAFVRGLVEAAGLHVAEVTRGRWARDADPGRSGTFQDLVVVEKPRLSLLARARRRFTSG
jgi:SAM-dependent methyltransferase